MLQMTKAGFRMFLRNRGNLFWTFVLPIIMIVIFGAVFGRQSDTVAVGVWDRAGTPQAEAVVQELAKIPAFKLSDLAGDQALAAVRQQNVAALVELPPSFGQGNDTVQVLFSGGTAPQASGVEAALRQLGMAVTLQRLHLPPAFTVQSTTVTGPNLNYIDFLVGGIIAMTIMQAGLFGVGIGIVEMRQRGVLRRLRATPLSPAAFLASRFLLYLVIAMAQAGVLLGIAMGFYHVHFAGNPALFLGICLLGAAVFVTLGLAISGLSRTVESANSISSVLNFLLMFLSGIFWQVSLMPQFFQWIARVSPLTYFADALRDVLTLGEGFAQVGRPLEVLMITGIVAALLAWRTYRWE
ncbi:MAG TPA: ABC transporter permease [Spirochaetia bacterium]|nr:ABC transporter permease [Spirochaetia bacterium]